MSASRRPISWCTIRKAGGANMGSPIAPVSSVGPRSWSLTTILAARAAASYGGKAGRYHCEGALVNHGAKRCISFGGLRADQAVASAVLGVLKPLGVDAALKALEAQASEMSAAHKQLELALQRAL